MRVLIDGDGCPVTRLTAELCAAACIPCLIFCNTAHEFDIPGTQTILCDKGADSADFVLTAKALPGDLAVTQDYGLAAMLLSRGIRVLHQDGWEYTSQNIDLLLAQRHAARKLRAAGKHLKGPKKRTKEQDAAFREALAAILPSRDTPQAVPCQRPPAPPSRGG